MALSMSTCFLKQVKVFLFLSMLLEVVPDHALQSHFMSLVLLCWGL